MSRLARILATLVLLFPLSGFCATLWDVTFSGTAYNSLTGEIGNQAVRYRYDPDDLELLSVGSFTFLTGFGLNYWYQGVDNGAGGSFAIFGESDSVFHYTEFGGTLLNDNFPLTLEFFTDPFEHSATSNNPTGTPWPPFEGGEGNFQFLRDISEYTTLGGLPIPGPDLLFTVTVSRVSEPATIALLFLALAALGIRGWTQLQLAARRVQPARP